MLDAYLTGVLDANINPKGMGKLLETIQILYP
jgi:hypothetical protein